MPPPQRTSNPQRRRLLPAVLTGMLIGLLMAVSTAAASDVTVSNCAKLQPTLNAVEEGEVITLAALCTKSNSGKAEGVFRLPSSVADVTIEGQAGTTAGFDGTGVKGSALESRGKGLVLRNLTIENYSLNERSAVTLDPGEGALPAIEADRFLDDTSSSTSGNSSRGGALSIFASSNTCAYTAPLSIVDSLFQGDHIADTSTTEHNRDQGGALYAELRCNSAATAPFELARLDGNTYAEDAIDTQAGGEAFGGALDLTSASGPGVEVSATQAGNVFENDSIASSSPTGVYGGGGEWASSLELSSTDDRYTGNSLPAPRGASASSLGAGLGLSTSSCAGDATASATLEDAVLAANAIGPASEAGESAGAGLYAACTSTEPNVHFHLSLDDSTVAGNQAPGGVSGIDGEDADQLALANSIVASPPGQADIGGFRTNAGGSLASSFSDACAPGVSTNTALPGEGNICAAPLLAGEATGDVHETASSPTIDAGSNALVPAALTTDALGDARILPGHSGCGQSFPAIVDIGADELTPPAPSCSPAPAIQKSPPSPLRPGLARFVRLVTGSTGAALRLSCSSSSDGLGCSGAIYVIAEETLRGKQVLAVGAGRVRHRRSVTIGQAPFSLPAGATATFTVELNAAGRALLRRFHTVSARVSASEASPAGAPLVFFTRAARFGESKPPTRSKRSRRR